jgi:Uma2 family endonuclease
MQPMTTLKPVFVPKTPPSSQAMEPLRWTCGEFHRLCDEGWFDGSRVILVDGEILAIPMAAPPHNLSLGLADDWLRTVFTTGFHIRNQTALDVGTDNDPGPDLAVVTGYRRDYRDRQATSAVLVVEIADSSLSIDTKTKSHLYALAGVPEYWVLDVNARQLHVFREPIADEAAPRGHRYSTVHC